MSEFLRGYIPESTTALKEETSPDPDQAAITVESQSSESQSSADQSSELQSPVTLEQVTFLAKQNPEIQEFLNQQNLSSEKLTDLYASLHQAVKNNPNLLTLDLVKKTTTDILSSNSSVREKRPFHQRAISLAAAILFALLGPAAFKDRSASASAATKSKVPTSTTETAPATTATAEEIASQILSESAISSEEETYPEAETIELKTVSEWTFDYETDVHRSQRRDFPLEDFNKLVNKIKAATSYGLQIVLIRSYARLGTPISYQEIGTAWEIAFNTAETQRFREMLTIPSVKEADGYTIYQTFLNLYNLYQDEAIDPSYTTSIFNGIINHATDEKEVAYEDETALEENRQVVEAFKKQKFLVNGKEISFKDLNKKIDSLLKQAKKLAPNKKKTAELWVICEEMVGLLELRRQSLIDLFLQLKNRSGENYTIPTIKLSEYPIPNTPDVTLELGIERK